MVGGFTCSAAASCPRVSGPPKTTTESADNRGEVIPIASSSRRSRRRSPIAAEWSWSARASGFGDIAHEADHVALSIADESDPDLAAAHPRDHVGLFDRRRSCRRELRMGRLDVRDVVVDDGSLLIVFPTGFGS